MTRHMTPLSHDHRYERAEENHGLTCIGPADPLLFLFNQEDENPYEDYL